MILPLTTILSVLAPTPNLISPLLYVCPPFLQFLPPSPFPSTFSEAGDMQALANLNTVAKQNLRLHAPQCWFRFCFFLELVSHLCFCAAAVTQS